MIPGTNNSRILTNLISSGKNQLHLGHLVNKKVSTTSTSQILSKSLPNFFPDFYGNYDYETRVDNSSAIQLFGLFPSDYDGGLVLTNDSTFLGFKPETMNANTLSAPLLYITLMLGIYLFIILIAFMSALYSHRKRMGYSYDETVGYATQSDESSDENALIDPELQKLNIKPDNSAMMSSVEQVMDVSQQNYECFSVISSNDDEKKLCNENSDEYEMIDFKSLNKLKKKKSNQGKYKQFSKRHEEKHFNKSRSSKRRRLKKLRTDKISMLFLKKFSQLFLTSETKLRKGSIENEYDTEMLANSLLNSENKFSSKPLVIDEDEF